MADRSTEVPSGSMRFRMMSFEPKLARKFHGGQDGSLPWKDLI
jgi:hypothetical protein